MQSVLVIGSRGMVGHMLCKVLARHGFQIVSTSRDGNDATFPLNIADPRKGFEQIAKEASAFQFIVNAAAVLAQDIKTQSSESVSQAIEVNSLFPWQLAEFASGLKSRLIHISTDGVFPPSAGECDENSKTGANDLYGCSKLLGEPRADHVLNLRCSIIGPSPFRGAGLMEWLLKQEANAQIQGFGNHYWNGVSSLQLANLCAALMSANNFEQAREEGGVHHFCPNQDTTKFELLSLLSDNFRPDVKVTNTEAAVPCHRVLRTCFKTLPALAGIDRPMTDLIQELRRFLEK